MGTSFTEYKARKTGFNHELSSGPFGADRMRLSIAEFWRQQEQAFQAGVQHAAATFRAYRELDELARSDQAAARQQPLPRDPLDAFRSIFGG